MNPAAVDALLDGLDRTRVHLLIDRFVDLELGGEGTGKWVRVFCCPWTPLIARNSGHYADTHFARPASDAVFWESKWSLLDAAADVPDTRPLLLVTHGPCYGRLDLVGRVRNVGCEWLLKKLRSMARPPLLHVCGHIHAKQYVGHPSPQQAPKHPNNYTTIPPYHRTTPPPPHPTPLGMRASLSSVQG